MKNNIKDSNSTKILQQLAFCNENIGHFVSLIQFRELFCNAYYFIIISRSIYELYSISDV